MQPHYEPGAAVLPVEMASALREAGAKTVELVHNGAQCVAASWTLDIATAVTRRGYHVSSPIEQEYRWPGLYQPMAHQITTAGHLTLNPRTFLLSDPGTGKTASVIWAWDYLRSINRAGRLLVAAPLSCLRSVWEDELFRLAPHRTVAILHGDRSERRKRLAAGADVFVINHNGLTVLADELAKDTSITHIAIDEASMFKNPRADIYKALVRIVGSRAVWMITGTPNAQNPWDCWSLCRIVAPSRVPRSLGLFRDALAMKRGQYDWDIRPEAKGIVHKAMQPAVRFAREQCLDLPECVPMFRDSLLSAEQKAAATKIKKDWLIQDQTSSITAANAAARLTKLLQIYQGAVIDDEDNAVNIDSSPRLQVLDEILQEVGGKVVIFANYRAVLAKIASHLHKSYTVETIDGSVSEPSRRDIVRRFQLSPDPQILVCHPKTTSHGLTLTAASALIWFGPVFSVETYTQGNQRIDRKGQTKTTAIYHITASAIERQAFARVRNKVDDQMNLLTLYNAEMERS